MTRQRAKTAAATLIVTWGTAVSLRAQPAASPDVEAVPTAPIELDGSELFRVRGVSSLPAAERARRVRAQIVLVAGDRSIAVESLQIVDGDGVTRIMAGTTTVMTIVDADAALEGVQRSELASAHLARVQRAVTSYRESRSPAALRRAAGNALAATAFLVASLAALVWGWRRVDRVLTPRLQARLQGIRFQSFQVMRADQIWASLRSVLLALRTIAFLVIGLVYAGFVLAQFPWTRAVSRNMAASALVPLRVLAGGLVESIPSLVFLAVLFVVVRLGLRLVRLFFEAVRRGTVTIERFDPEWAAPTYNLVRLAVVALALVVAYPYIPGSGTAAFQGVSIFFGVVFSLGSSTAIANIVAGYMMTYRRALKIGDRVRIGEAIGDVIDTRLQVTHLCSFKNEEIIIPNSQILAAEVLNYSSLARLHGLILHTDVALGYDTSWRQAEALLFEAAGRTEGLSREPRPFVLEKRLGEFAVTYELNAYCSDVKAMNELYAALHRNILDVFNEHGVQIMTPAYEADPPEPKVVPPAQWQAGPADGVMAIAAQRGPGSTP